MKFHPIAEIFPLLEGPEFVGLAEDIKSQGQREPIIIFEDKILDGRNRWRACQKAGVEPKTKEYKGKDPLAYVISLNLKRRHLDTSQRDMVAARIATLEKHKHRNPDAQNCASQPEAATLMNVSRRGVQQARVILDKGTPELIAAVDQGKLPVSQAARMIKESPDTQRQMVKRIVEDGVKPQEAARQEKAAQAKQSGKLPAAKYRVVYADPPWSYGNTQPDYHPEQRDHYPVMSLKEIADLPISDMVENDAVLFLWVTSPILEDSFAVIKAWGFKYKASFVWDKIKHNMGHYNSVRHEFLLVCVRGSCQPDERKLFDSVVTEERKEHSRKPEIFREIIDTIYTAGKRIELFRRGPAIKGWDSWGNENV